MPSIRQYTANARCFLAIPAFPPSQQLWARLPSSMLPARPLLCMHSIYPTFPPMLFSPMIPSPTILYSDIPRVFLRLNCARCPRGLYEGVRTPVTRDRSLRYPRNNCTQPIFSFPVRYPRARPLHQSHCDDSLPRGRVCCVCPSVSPFAPVLRILRPLRRQNRHRPIHRFVCASSRQPQVFVCFPPPSRP